MSQDHWVKDDFVLRCTSCQADFTGMSGQRRHHCRSCGEVFCEACTQRRLLMPELGFSSNPQRCCEGCFTARSVQHAIPFTDDAKILNGLHTLYRQGIKPLERLYMYDSFYSPMLSAADFDTKPLVLLLGQYSVGKTSFIKHMLGRDYPNSRIGPEPTTERFTLVTLSSTDKDQVIPGNALVVQTNRPFKSLEKFGSAFLSKFEAAEVAVAPDAETRKLPGAILHRLSFLDSPGVLSGEKQRLGRAYNFSGVVEFFGGRADRILLLFDAHKLDISDEFKACIEALRNDSDKIRIILNKSDAIDAQQLMKVHGALMWSLGKVFKTPECLRVYVGSWTDEPRPHDFDNLFKREQEELLKDLYELPASAVMRKVNEVVKRARAARVHALIIDHLRTQLPWIGKDAALQQLLGNLPNEFKTLSQMHGIPYGDFPAPDLFVRAFQAVVATADALAAFPPLNQQLMAEGNEIISARLPHLVAEFQRNNARVREENPFEEDRQWGVPPDFFTEAKSEYEALGPDANGLVSGSQVRPVLQQTGLSNKVLAKMWQLADRDRDGKLTAKEFALAKWLIKIYPDGNFPDVLPRSLEPV